MVEANWLIGKRIVEEEQHGKHRAEYGREITKNLSVELQNEFGRGFGERGLRDFRLFYLTFKELDFGTQFNEVSVTKDFLVTATNGKNYKKCITSLKP